MATVTDDHTATPPRTKDCAAITVPDSIARVNGEEKQTSIVVSIAGLTDVGHARDHNEDSFLVSDLAGDLTRGPDEVGERRALGRGLAIGVYDGMGGMSSGELGSRDAAIAVASSLRETPLPSVEDDLRDRLVRAVVAANRSVFEAAERDMRRRGSGTTATVAALVDAGLVIAQAGDSRAYLLRSDSLMQITRDDRLTAEALRAAGHAITEEEALALPKNVITKALGLTDTVEPTITRVTLRRGDVVVVCSDGLWELVADAEIRAALLRHRDPSVACRVLRDMALRAGGYDNITIVVARFDGEGLRPPVRSETVEI